MYYFYYDYKCKYQNGFKIMFKLSLMSIINKARWFLWRHSDNVDKCQIMMKKKKKK